MRINEKELKVKDFWIVWKEFKCAEWVSMLFERFTHLCGIRESKGRVWKEETSSNQGKEGRILEIASLLKQGKEGNYLMKKLLGYKAKV